MNLNTKSNRTLIEIVDERLAEHHITDEALLTQLGYRNTQILKLVRNGSMKFPLDQLPRLLDVVGGEPLPVIKAAIGEHSPGLWTVIDAYIATITSKRDGSDAPPPRS